MNTSFYDESDDYPFVNERQEDRYACVGRTEDLRDRGASSDDYGIHEMRHRFDTTRLNIHDSSKDSRHTTAALTLQEGNLNEKKSITSVVIPQLLPEDKKLLDDIFHQELSHQDGRRPLGDVDPSKPEWRDVCNKRSTSCKRPPGWLEAAQEGSHTRTALGPSTLHTTSLQLSDGDTSVFSDRGTVGCSEKKQKTSANDTISMSDIPSGRYFKAGEIPPDKDIPHRTITKIYDYAEENFEFQLLDLTTGKDEYSPSRNNASRQGTLTRSLRESVVYLHGVSEGGESVCVKYLGYRPYFYLSVPEGKGAAWLETVTAELKKDYRDLPVNDLFGVKIVHFLPTVGFRNGEKLPFVEFTFWTYDACFKYRLALEMKFPAPTRADVHAGRYRNDVMVCEAQIPEEVKFCVSKDIQNCGWVRLRKKLYRDLETGAANAMHAFSTSVVECVPEKTHLGACVIDSIDIETLKYKSDEEEGGVPNPDDPKNMIASIAHVIRSSTRQGRVVRVVFTWGGDVLLPQCDGDGKPLSQKDIDVRIYEDEAGMLTEWVKWWRQRSVSPDVTIGHNIFGFDLGYIATRVRVVAGVPEECRVWGRLDNHESKIVESRTESKAITACDHKLTPTPGRSFLDTLVLFQRDVTLRLQEGCNLNALAQHFLKRGKYDVHHTEIKGLFYGTPEQRGKLMWYNVEDCDLAMDLFDIAGHFPKCSNVAKVNRIPLNMMARGQQIRVFGGFYYVARKAGYVVYRPHYDPALDSPIFEKLDQDENCLNGLEEVLKYWREVQEKYGWVPTFEMVNVHMDGKQTKTRLGTLDHYEDIAVQDLDSSCVKKIGNTENGTTLYPKTDTPLPATSASHACGSSNTNIQRKMVNGMTVDQIVSFYKRSGGRRTMKMADKIALQKRIMSGSDKKGAEKKDKGFSGGLVMDPEKGFFENVAILDFEALYPNIMMSYFLDPALLVLDKRFAACPGVKYLDVRFNDKIVFRFAQNLPGVMIQHTSNLVFTRKIAKGVMNSYADRMEQIRKHIIRVLDIKTPENATEEDKKQLEFSKILDRLEHEIVAEHSGSDVRTEEQANIIKDLLNEEFVTIKKRLTGYNTYSCEASCFEDLRDNYIDFCRLENKDALLRKNADYASRKEVARVAFQRVDFYFQVLKDIESGKIHSLNSAEASVIRLLHKFAVTYSNELVNYNTLQNELKVGSNSTFGFCGAGGATEYENTPSCTDQGCNSKTIDNISSHHCSRSSGSTLHVPGAVQGVTSTLLCAPVNDISEQSFTGQNNGKIKRKGMMQVMPVSACVTLIGRISIERAKAFAENWIQGTRVLYADTDSLFVKFPVSVVPDNQEGFEKTFVLSPKLSSMISALYTGSMLIVHEKTARAIILYSAKMYALYKFEAVDKPGVLEIKGLSIKKRDCCKFVASICKKALDMIIIERNVAKAENFISEQAMSLVNGKVPLEELVFYKKLAKNNYSRKEETGGSFVVTPDGRKVSVKKLTASKKIQIEVTKGPRVAHAILAERINVRKMGAGPRTGEAVKFLVVDIGDHSGKKKMSERIEDYEYTKENKLRLDLLWYLENPVFQNVTKIFSVVLGNPEKMLESATNVQKRKQLGFAKTLTNVIPAQRSEYLAVN